MKYEIKNRVSGDLIFSCEADSLKSAVRIAIELKANLSGANLSGANLSWANLSWANLSGAKNKAISIYGLKFPIVVSEEKVFIGCVSYTHEEAKKVSFEDVEKFKIEENEFEEIKTIYTTVFEILSRQTKKC